MVRSHHERWDGTGYPDGLAGEEIPLAARILAVADALDAMLSPRPVPAGARRWPRRCAEIKAGTPARSSARTVAAAASSVLDRDPGLYLNVTVHASTEGVDALQTDRSCVQ